MNTEDYSGGDGRRRRTPRNPKMGRMYNGLTIPIFTNDDDDEDCHTYKSCHDVYTRNADTCQTSDYHCENPDQRKYHIDVLEQYYTCPICYDPCIESTMTNCGHKFCKACIDKWSGKKPVCPICSTLITSQHRIFNDDLFIESQLGCLSASVKDRFETAQTSRLQTLYKSHHSKNMLKAVRRKLDNSVSFLRSKSVSELGDNVRYSAHRILSALPTYSSNNGILIGILIGVGLMLLASFLMNRASFLTYIFLAIQNYNGTIPEAWIKSENEIEPTFKLPPKNQTMVEEESFFSSIITFFGNCGVVTYCTSFMNNVRA
ncbi:unnamed protein product [Orchesella dallaii]|uniref:RING-type domain-containing protein n=1 Tax=Orchesella dallaii TaxID=48710 RepID=A0ABP1QDF3_9HEXA